MACSSQGSSCSSRCTPACWPCPKPLAPSLISSIWPPKVTFRQRPQEECCLIASVLYRGENGRPDGTQSIISNALSSHDPCVERELWCAGPSACRSDASPGDRPTSWFHVAALRLMKREPLLGHAALTVKVTTIGASTGWSRPTVLMP